MNLHEQKKGGSKGEECVELNGQLESKFRQRRGAKEHPR